MVFQQAVADTTWKSAILSRVDALTAKLGVTAEHLWGVLVRQAIVQAVTDAILVGLLIVVGLVAYKAAVWAMGKVDDDDAWGVLLFVSIAVVIGCIVAVPILSVVAVREAMNPEYWAFRSLFPTP